MLIGKGTVSFVFLLGLVDQIQLADHFLRSWQLWTSIPRVRYPYSLGFRRTFNCVSENRSKTLWELQKINIWLGWVDFVEKVAFKLGGERWVGFWVLVLDRSLLFNGQSLAWRKHAVSGYSGYNLVFWQECRFCEWGGVPNGWNQRVLDATLRSLAFVLRRRVENFSTVNVPLSYWVGSHPRWFYTPSTSDMPHRFCSQYFLGPNFPPSVHLFKYCWSLVSILTFQKLFCKPL